MKRYKILILIILIINVLQKSVNARDTLTLKSCYSGSIQNYPLGQVPALLENQSSLKIKNIQSMWLPGSEFKGQVTYQSDVATIDMSNIPIPGIEMPTPGKDQYKLSVTVNQMLYDGGIVNAQKKLENSSLISEIQNIKVKQYQLRSRINQVYFLILVLQKQQQLLDTLINDLKIRHIEIKSAVQNGVVLASNQYVLEAEILKLQQQLQKIRIDINSCKGVLNQLTGLEIKESTILESPQVAFKEQELFTRPEQQLYGYQKDKVEALNKVVMTDRMPKVTGFIEAGYGNPGLNMLSDKWDTYYMLGARVNWTIYDWNSTRRKQQINKLTVETLSKEEEIFIKSVEIEAINQKGTINNLKQVITSDQEIYNLRQKVTVQYASRLKNGVITSSEYVSEKKAENEALTNLEVHNLQLTEAIVNYFNIIGLDY